MASDVQAEDSIESKRKRCKFVDIEAKEPQGDRKDKKKRKRKAAEEKDSHVEKKSRPKKLLEKEKKAMVAGRRQMEKLFSMLRGNDGDDPDSHYSIKSPAVKKGIAEAYKWCYTAEREELGDPMVGWDTFWDWYKKGMNSRRNVHWQELHPDEDLKDQEVWAKIEIHIQSLEDDWKHLYETCIPNRDSILLFKAWVENQLAKDDVQINPLSTDKAMAETIQKYLSDTIILTDEDGSSITWEEKERLWVYREKDRTPGIIGASLFNLYKVKIFFTDVEMEEKWLKRVQSAGSIANVVHWLRSVTPLFPNPVKQKLDRDMWTFPLKNGKIVEIKTLTVRDRNRSDLYTSTGDFEWLEDLPMKNSELKLTIMETVMLGYYKMMVKEQKTQQIWDALELLCPNAYRFCKGPFQDEDRFRGAMLQLSLGITTFCTRKALWIFGDGKGMKSTVLEALVNAMGDKAVMLHKKVFFVTQDDQGQASHNTDLMRAYGKRLVVIDELARHDKLKETIYKTTVAHGKISSRNMYKKQEEWRFMGMVTFLSNVVVSLNFNNNSISDRTMAIRGTTRVFNPTDMTSVLPPMWKDQASWVDQLDEKTGTYWVIKDAVCETWAKTSMVPEDQGGFQNELGCFFILLAHYAYTLVTKPENCGELPVSKKVADDFQQFIKEADHIVQWIKENCIIEKKDRSKQHRTPFDQIIADYKAWCADQNMKAGENKHVKQTLKARNLLVFEAPMRWDEARKKMRPYGHKKPFGLLMLRKNHDSFQQDESVLEKKEKEKEEKEHKGLNNFY